MLAALLSARNEDLIHSKKLFPNSLGSISLRNQLLQILQLELQIDHSTIHIIHSPRPIQKHLPFHDGIQHCDDVKKYDTQKKLGVH